MINLPVSQGRVLRTRNTERWSKEEVDLGNSFEELRVYSDFSYLDEGRSRQLIAVCETPELAKELVDKLNLLYRYKQEEKLPALKTNRLAREVEASTDVNTN